MHLAHNKNLTLTILSPLAVVEIFQVTM